MFKLKNVLLHGNIIILVALILVATAVSDYFLTFENIINVVRVASLIGVVAIGMNMVIILAGIDLSVGSVVAITGAVTAGLWNTGNPQLFVALPLLIAICVGCLNGGMVAWFRMQPFVATLIMMTVVRGAGLVYTGGQPIYADYPDWFSYLARGIVFGLPVPTVIFIIVTLAAWYIMRWRQIGREIYAIGSNETAAWLSGISVQIVKIKAYAFCAFCAGVAGLIMTARIGSGEPGQVGVFLELDAIAAVVIGGTSLRGGKGSVWGAVIGVLIISIVNNLFNLLGVGPAWQQVAKGTIIILAVILQSLSDGTLSFKDIFKSTGAFFCAFVRNTLRVHTWMKPVLLILVPLMIINVAVWQSSKSMYEVDFAKAPYRIANNLELTRVYHRAKPLYQEVIDTYPNSKYALLSRIGIANILFKTGALEQSKAAYIALLDTWGTGHMVAKMHYDILNNYIQLLQEMQDDETFKDIYQLIAEMYPNSDALTEAGVYLKQLEAKKIVDNSSVLQNAPVIIMADDVVVPDAVKVGGTFEILITVKPNGGKSTDFSVMTPNGFWNAFMLMDIMPQPRGISEFWGKQAWAYGQISEPMQIKVTLKAKKIGIAKFDLDVEQSFNILDFQIVKSITVGE